MLTLRIVSYFVGSAFDLLINSNKLKHTVIRFKKTLLIHPCDVEEITKILDRNSIKYYI